MHQTMGWISSTTKKKKEKSESKVKLPNSKAPVTKLPLGLAKTKIGLSTSQPGSRSSPEAMQEADLTRNAGLALWGSCLPVVGNSSAPPLLPSFPASAGAQLSLGNNIVFWLVQGVRPEKRGPWKRQNP
jgi:hypothetical protein